MHNALTAMGYRQVGSLSMGSVGTNERVRVPVALDAGACTTWVAIGAQGVRDISLEVLDPDGRSVGQDRTSDPQAAVQVCADVSGEHVVVLTVESGAGEYLLAAWEGGGRSPSRGGPTGGEAGTCADPIAIAPGETKSGDTARGQSQIVPTCSESVAKEIVYSLTIEARTAVRVVVESQFDAMVYMQRTCGQQDTELACNDDNPDQHHAQIDAVLEPGAYSIVVDGYQAEEGIYSVEVSVSAAPAIATLCGGATRLVPGTAVRGSTAGGQNNFEASCAGNAQSPDTLYRLDVAERSRVRLVQDTPQHDGALYVRSDCAQVGSELGCNDDFVNEHRSLVSLVVEPGAYFVYSDGYGSRDAGPFDLLADVVPAAGTGTEGDACAAALTLSAGTIEGDTMRARDDLSGSCTQSPGAPDVVYKLTVARRARVRLAFEPGIEFQGAIYVQRTCGDRATEVACSAGPEVDTILAAGTYFVVVDGATSTAFGRYRLTAQVDDTAALEAACRQAPALQPGQTTAGSTGGADRFQPSCAPGARSPENLYKLRVARRSRVRLALAAGYDAVLSVRRDCMDRATEMGCNDDAQDENHSLVEQVLEPGTYTVFVDGYGSGSSGTFTLDATVEAP